MAVKIHYLFCFLIENQTVSKHSADTEQRIQFIELHSYEYKYTNC